MLSETEQKILQNPKFIRLRRIRNRASCWAMLFMVVFYLGFQLAMTYLPELLARTLFDVVYLSYAMIWALLVVIATIGLTGFYTWFNSRFLTPLEDAIRREAGLG